MKTVFGVSVCYKYGPNMDSYFCKRSHSIPMVHPFINAPMVIPGLKKLRFFDINTKQQQFTM